MIDYIHVLISLKHEPSEAELGILDDRIKAWCEEFCLEPYSVEMQATDSGDGEDES